MVNDSSLTHALQDIATLATFNVSLGELNDAAIYIKGNVIDWVGTTADLPADKNTADKVVSLADHVVIPGLVNTHHHMFQCITRCVAQVKLTRALRSCLLTVLLFDLPCVTSC